MKVLDQALIISSSLSFLFQLILEYDSAFANSLLLLFPTAFILFSWKLFLSFSFSDLSYSDLEKLKLFSHFLRGIMNIEWNFHSADS